MSNKHNIPLSVSSYVDLTDEGIKVINYLDVNGKDSDEAIEIEYKYDQWKYDLISSFVIPKRIDNESFDDAVKAGHYVFPRCEDSNAILAEVRKLKEFAAALEKELMDNMPAEKEE